MDGTPIYDVKPYLPYADCRPEAAGRLCQPAQGGQPAGGVSPGAAGAGGGGARAALLGVLAPGSAPHYQHDPDRVYGLAFGGWEVKFTVAEDVLTVREIFHRRQEPEPRDRPQYMPRLCAGRQHKSTGPYSRAGAFSCMEWMEDGSAVCLSQNLLNLSQTPHDVLCLGCIQRRCGLFLIKAGVHPIPCSTCDIRGERISDDDRLFWY